MTARPIHTQPHYGQHLRDPSYWGPYVRHVLEREGLASARLDRGCGGSFPTFLVGDVVVKLFGPDFDGPRSWGVERAMHQLLAGHSAVPAPTLLGSGRLYEDEPTWPYLITQRLSGLAARDLALPASVAETLAGEVGLAVAALHRLPPPRAVARRRLIPDLRANAPERARRFGLPDHLSAQVADFLVDAEAPGTLVHADITADHIFVVGGRLEALIDWGDALIADRSYELAATWLDALAGNRRFLRRFLDAYGWEVSDVFPRRALQGILEFQFDGIGAVRDLVDLDAVSSLDDLADRLFGWLLS